MGGLGLNISPEAIALFLLGFIIVLILFVMNISTRSELKRLRKKYNNFMNGFGDKNIEELLEANIKQVNEVVVKNRDIENHLNNIDRNLLQCIQKVGAIRYNAFENVGSDLSFAVALLDSSDNGFVISGIYSRDSSSTYAKPIVGGKSKYALSAEEIQAIEMARKSHREKLYTDKQFNS